MKDNALDTMLELIAQRQEPYAAINVTLLEKGLSKNDRKQHEARIREAIEVYRNPPPPLPLHHRK